MIPNFGTMDCWLAGYLVGLLVRWSSACWLVVYMICWFAGTDGGLDADDDDDDDDDGDEYDGDAAGDGDCDNDDDHDDDYNDDNDADDDFYAVDSLCIWNQGTQPYTEQDHYMHLAFPRLFFSLKKIKKIKI